MQSSDFFRRCKDFHKVSAMNDDTATDRSGTALWRRARASPRPSSPSYSPLSPSTTVRIHLQCCVNPASPPEAVSRNLSKLNIVFRVFTNQISGNGGVVVVGGFSEFQMGLVTAACAVAAAVFAFCIRPKSGEGETHLFICTLSDVYKVNQKILF